MKENINYNETLISIYTIDKGELKILLLRKKLKKWGFSKWIIRKEY